MDFPFLNTVNENLVISNALPAIGTGVPPTSLDVNFPSLDACVELYLSGNISRYFQFIEFLYCLLTGSKNIYAIACDSIV